MPLKQAVNTYFKSSEDYWPGLRKAKNGLNIY